MLIWKSKPRQVEFTLGRRSGPFYVQQPDKLVLAREGWVTAVISGLGMIREVQSCLHWEKDDNSVEW